MKANLSKTSSDLWWDAIDPLWGSYNSGLSQRDVKAALSQYSDKQVALLAVFVFEAEVCNGGLDIYISCAGHLIPETLLGFKIIGANSHFELLSNAVSLAFQSEEVPIERDVRMNMWTTWWEDNHQLDERVGQITYEGQLRILAEKHIRASMSDFFNING